MDDRHAPSFTERMAAYSKAWRRDGVVHIPAALDAEHLALARRLFDWSRAHPGAAALGIEPDEHGDISFVDTHNRAARPLYCEALRGTDLPRIAAAVLGVERLWFLGEQIFVKQGAPGSGGTIWHQDADFHMDLLNGPGGVGMWIAFEALEPEYGLKFIRKSQGWPIYNPIIGMDGSRPRLLFRNNDLDAVPDVDADLQKYDVAAWTYQPGDVILFHTNILHGGGPTPPSGLRNTLSIRFISADVIYSDRLRRNPYGTEIVNATDYLWEGLRSGMPMHEGIRFEKVFEAEKPAAEG